MKTKQLRILIAGGMCAVCATAAPAVELVDPTRPPQAPRPAAPSQETVRVPVLQSIIITPRTRVAIIDGNRVEVDGRVGDSRLAAIRENEVVLRSSSGTEVLKLYPDVNMKPAKDVRQPRSRGRSKN